MPKETTNGGAAVQITSTSSAHNALIHAYGLFMVMWSVLETVLQAGIMKALDIDARRAVVVTGKLQFNPRVQLLISLLKMNGAEREVINLLNRTEGFAHRNVLVHGVIVIGDPEFFTFVKFDGASSVKKKYSPLDLLRHVQTLTERVEELQRLLAVSNADIQMIGEATVEFATSTKE